MSIWTQPTSNNLFTRQRIHQFKPIDCCLRNHPPKFILSPTPPQPNHPTPTTSHQPNKSNPTCMHGLSVSTSFHPAAHWLNDLGVNCGQLFFFAAMPRAWHMLQVHWECDSKTMHIDFNASTSSHRCHLQGQLSYDLIMFYILWTRWITSCFSLPIIPINSFTSCCGIPEEDTLGSHPGP